MFCPQCKKAELKENTSIGKSWFRWRKIITYFCPLCTFERRKTFSMTSEDAEFEFLRMKNFPKLNIHKHIEQQNGKINVEYDD